MSKLYVVGIGPGKEDGLTIEAKRALEISDCIVGYTGYVDLVKQYLPEKEYLATGMTKETDRVMLAIEQAKSQKTVALICSGDAAVYGLAGLVYEMADGAPEVDIEVISGVSAVLSGSALLGAAVGHDFAVISLSDLLTPWSEIEQKIAGAAMADFVICLYNPGSKKRVDYLKRACDIMLRYKSGETVCGVTKNIGRQGEDAEIMSLSKLRDYTPDMFTTVFVGNRNTKVLGGKMVTPRGYLQRESVGNGVDEEYTKRSIGNTVVCRDEAFLRNTTAHVPMTKYPVRVLAINELDMAMDSVAYDIGAGTGSVTVEMAKRCPLGKVYAIEKKVEAVDILRKNIQEFGLKNIEVIAGAAPESLETLPAPDRVFIGGSSGELEQIVEYVREKNPNTLFVVTAVTLETMAILLNISKKYPEYKDMRMMQVAVSDCETVGSYHMQHANNPVYIACFGGLDNKTVE